ncbi:MAG TPA: hypothetical protein VK891_15705 [Euzebyales bacterium]|nr:hypothetical protein [Euzebyales bacterium]
MRASREAASVRRAAEPGRRGAVADIADLDRDGELRSAQLPGFAVRLGDLVER